MDQGSRAVAMSPVDRAWLEMDEPHNPMVVSAIFQLDGGVRPAAMKQLVFERLLCHARFRQRADDRHYPPRWLEDGLPQIDYHVHLRPLKGPDAQAQLRAAIAAELGGELDRFRPLWRVVLFSRRGHPLTVLFRGHHAMGDGIALLHTLLGCTDAAVRKRGRASGVTEHVAHGGPLGGLIDQLEAANRALEKLRRAAADDLRHPRHLVQQLADGRQLAGAVARLLTLPEDNPPLLRQPLGGRRAVAWIEALPLARFRRAAQAQGVKLNDLFMAIVAGAVGGYLRAMVPDLPPAQNLRVSIPVNLRSGETAGSGNCFGLVLLDLPVGAGNARERLETVARRMSALKDSGEARAVLLGLAAAGHLPVMLEKKLVEQVAGKAAAVVSNLHGPGRQQKIGGGTIRSLVFWPPQSGGIGLGVSLFSYAGKLSIGVSVDTVLVGNPQLLIDQFRHAIDELTSARCRRPAIAPRRTLKPGAR
jgi:WS/DGAT/MGAT family acyltransferase